MTSGKSADSQSKTIPKYVAWGAVALLMFAAWRYTNIFGEHGGGSSDEPSGSTSTTSQFSYCERRKTLGEEKFLSELTVFREEQQAKGRLSANDENAGVILMIEVQHSFAVHCPEFTLASRP